MTYWDRYDKKTDFTSLLGKTLTSISGEVGSGEMTFAADDGSVYVLYHDQDCCESVNIESIVGDLADLLGSPILKAEVATSGEAPPDVQPPEYGWDSTTWTFYKLATIKGYVDIRWLGESNGYYSESVDFAKVA